MATDDDKRVDGMREELEEVREFAKRRSEAHAERLAVWRRVHLGLGIPSVALAAIAGTSALANFDHSNIVAGVLALVVAALTGLLTFLRPEQETWEHDRAVKGFQSLYGESSRIRNLDLAWLPPWWALDREDDIRELVREVSKQFDVVKSQAPALPPHYAREWDDKDRAAKATRPKAIRAPRPRQPARQAPSRLLGF